MTGKKKVFLVVGLLLSYVIGVVIGYFWFSSKEEKDNSKEVLLKLNGTELTRDDLSSVLDAAETKGLEEYVNVYMLDLFYKDYPVEESEVDAQIAILKGQVEEDQWESYREYLGYSSDETLRTGVRQYLQRLKMLEEKYKPNITKTDEEYKEIYDSEPMSFNTVTLNTVLCNTEEQFEKGKNLLIQGKALEEVATELSIEEKKNINSYEYYFTSTYTLIKGKIEKGAVGYSTNTTDPYTLVEVTNYVNTFEELKDSIKDTVIAKEADSALNEDLDFFYKGAEVIIKGEKR